MPTSAAGAARSPWFIFAVALAARLAIMLALYNSPQLPLTAFWDTGLEMGRVTTGLLRTGEFRSPFLLDSGPSAVMTPVYPLLIAVVFKLFGTMTAAAAWAVLILQSLFSALVCVLLYRIGEESFSRGAGLLAAWLWAAWPYTEFQPLFRFWENTLAALLAACAFLLLLRLQRATSFPAWFGFGAVTGIAALNNPSLLPFVVAIAAWICYRRNRAGLAWLRPALIAAFALALAIAPWTIRNYRVFHRLIPVRDGLGLELWVGNHPGATGKQDLSIHPVTDPAEAARFRDQGELAYIHDKQEQALAFIRSHPGTFARLTMKRAWEFWFGWDAFGLSWTTVPIFLIAFAQLLWMMVKRSPDAVIYAAPLLLYPLPFYITHPDVRFRHTIEPFLFALAGAALATVLERARNRQLASRSAVTSHD